MPWRLSNREKYNLNNKLMLTQDIIITSITVRAAPSYPPYAYPYDAWFMHSPLKIPLKGRADQRKVHLLSTEQGNK
jgi:hypothetical protein